MGGDFQVLDIILLAVIAGFLILRLRSVLGRRDGHEVRTPDPFKAANRDEGDSEDKVIRLPDRATDVSADDEDVFEDDDERPAPTGVEAGLRQIKRADRSFDVDEFLSGSRIAFEMILTAFAAGDSASLKPMLSPEVFNNFDQSIRDRTQAGEVMDLNLAGIQNAEIVEAYLTGRTAHITVKFTSEQISVIRDEHNDVIEGDPERVTEVVDFWTFARDTRSKDPNWSLVATGSME